MSRHTFFIKIDEPEIFRKKIIQFYKDERYFILLDSNSSENEKVASDSIIAIGAKAVLSTSYNNAWKSLRQFIKNSEDWVFGYLGYDLKNDLESLKSNNEDLVGFPDLLFFTPELVFDFSDSNLIVRTFSSEKDTAGLIKSIQEIELLDAVYPSNQRNQLNYIDTRESYISKVSRCLEHIQRGDIYEVNFCTAFHADMTTLETTSLYADLNSISMPPFAGLARMGSYNIISASPERFIKKKGSHIISQPIKGTAPRSQNPNIDLELIEQLRNDPKEQSENIMIVDLVRNDLSRTASRGSVKVSELMQVYSFKQVHQSISTVESHLDAQYDVIDLLMTTFPMGSMTGAPKISSMQIAEKQEGFKRGPYSGALGYITPQGDCDFNVLIRSVFYNASQRKLMLGIGSAITAQANPEKEYQECLLKAKALLTSLEKQGLYFDSET